MGNVYIQSFAENDPGIEELFEFQVANVLVRKSMSQDKFKCLA
jgi:hypothetical protein